MSVTEIDAVKHAVIEVIGVVFFLAFCLFFGLALMGAFDRDKE